VSAITYGGTIYPSSAGLLATSSSSYCIVRTLIAAGGAFRPSSSLLLMGSDRIDSAADYVGRGKLIRLIRAKVMTELEQSNITRHGRDAHALPSLPPGRTRKGRTEEGEG
jgi:hypothetical protein